MAANDETPTMAEYVAANPGMAAVELDITDLASIGAVAARLIADHPDLNVLINNAGIMLSFSPQVVHTLKSAIPIIFEAVSQLRITRSNATGGVS